MMAKRSRILILAASIALGLLYVLPLWTISLEAPQYPEGLGMVIRLHTIEGDKPHDLSNINNLNHYIGMKRIVPESIPELALMPFVVGALLVAGVGVAALGRRRLLWTWTIAFLAFAVVGLADFWKWEYDYGHDLDEENAIIKVPGMSYQPPLIGRREILNFTAHSWPGAGGAIAILVGATAVLVSAGEWRRRGYAKHAPEPADARHPVAPGAAATVALPIVALTACADPGPRALLPGVDACADCLMVLDGGGHGAEIVTRAGKVLTFDSAECMVNHLLHAEEAADARSLWVTDFSNPETLVPAEGAFFLIGTTLSSPMGLGVTAFARAQDRDGAVHAFGGEPADWEAVRTLVATAWPDGRPPVRHGGHTATLPRGPSASAR